MTWRLKKYLRLIFILAFYKVVQGLLELVGSMILLSLSYSQIHRLAVRLTREELLEDPKDIFVAYLFKYLPLLSEYKEQAGLILLALGIYDVVTGVGLFYEKNWARLVILIALIASLPYSSYELILKFDSLRLVFFVIQILFIYILWRYKPKEK